MSLIEDIDPDVLQNNIIRRNLTIGALKGSFDGLGRLELKIEE